MILPFDSPDITPYKPTCIDIETASDGSLLDIGLVYENEYCTFSDWRDFSTFIDTLLQNAPSREIKRRYASIYAHNGGKFDWLHYCDWLLENNAAREIYVIMSEQMIIGTKVTLQSGTVITLCDSLRLMPYALSKIASAMNKQYQKLYTGEYITHMEDMKKEVPEEYYSYLKNDVLALQEALYLFWEKIYRIAGNIGRLPMTLPSLSLRLFRKGLTDAIIVPWNDDIKEFTRRAYTGGRVECYKPGLYNHVQVYDVNSMYPYCMANFPVPVSARSRWVTHFNMNSLAFYEVTYDQDNTSIPPILRDEISKEFQYAGRGVYHTQEIKLLRQYGGTVKVHKGLEFQDTAILFKDFVSQWYGLRQEAKATADQALDFISKILLNSLYGKFGQRPVSKHLELATNEKIAKYVAQRKKVTVKGDFLLIEEQNHVEHEFTAIAATITAMARVTLYHHILRFGSSYLYSDTDSVHTLPHEIATTDGLGGFKLEYEGEGVYLGKKLYAIHTGVTEVIKAKGIGRAIKEGLLTFKSFVDLADGTAEQLILDFTTLPSVHDVLIKREQPAKAKTRTRTVRKT